MLKIRLKRVGRKKSPFYKIVLAESLAKRDGKSIQLLGYYNPLTKKISFNNLALHKYINNGAYPTNTVRHLIIKVLNQTYTNSAA